MTPVAALCALVASTIVVLEANMDDHAAPFCDWSGFYAGAHAGGIYASYSQSIAEPTIEADLIWRLPGNFRVHANANLESVKDTLPGEDNWFKGLGLLSDKIFLLYDADSYNLFAGKSDVAFGLARDEAWGLYGTDLADELGIESMLTFGTEFTVAEENSGELAVAAAAFMTDTTFLRDSLITQQGRTKGSDAGPSVSAQCVT